MFFYVDESGNTGNNLFDEHQPYLYYGLLSSTKNLDIVVEPSVRRMRNNLGVTRLHANELGVKGISAIADDIIALQKANDIRFDFYKIDKIDHAIFCFFDQVFDSAMNDAVPFTSYWTPLRYMMLAKVHALFTKDIIKLSWTARIELNDENAQKILVQVCQKLRTRTGILPDERSRELISGALIWAEKNPDKIQYNAGFKEHALQVSPNLIGFQQVLHGVARQVSSTGRKAKSIIVDQQCEFNKAQNILSLNYRIMRDAGIGTIKNQRLSGPHMPEPDYRGMPDDVIIFRSSDSSPGLELVDLYLWSVKRVVEGRNISSNISKLVYAQRHRGRTDEVSMHGIEARWGRWFEKLPELEDMSDEQISRGKEMLEIQEKRRKAALSDVS